MTDTRPTVLIVNHNKTDACGVYQHGQRAVDILRGSEKYRFVGVRCDDPEAFMQEAWRHDPRICIFNYYPGTMDWAASIPGFTADIFQCVGIAHEITHEGAHTPRPPFSKWIVADPSYPDSDIYFRTVRPLPSYTGSAKPPTGGPVIIGSFGYTLPGKDWARLYDAVKQEFGGGALLRLHVTRPHFDGGVGEQYQSIVREWADFANRTDAREFPRVEVTTDHWDDQTLLSWLASNHLNCLFYDANPGRGISSAVDWCVAAGRPLAITESEQFRHITPLLGRWPDVSLRESLAVHKSLESSSQVAPGMYPQPPVQQLQAQWSHEQFIADHERIVDTLLGGGES